MRSGRFFTGTMDVYSYAGESVVLPTSVGDDTVVVFMFNAGTSSDSSSVFTLSDVLAV